MAPSPFFLRLLFLGFVPFFCCFSVLAVVASPYRSPSTFATNYRRMLKDFKIFVYDRSSLSFNSSNPPVVSLFHSFLLESPFVTSDPDQAHLFYLTLPSDLSPRSVARSIRDLRLRYPFWNRTLGADHFYVSCAGIGIESDRNLVELKKNSIQISCFPATEGRFIPHKDVVLSPLSKHIPGSRAAKKFLGFFYGNGEGGSVSTVLDELRNDPEFLIELQPLADREVAERLKSSRFCLFFYGSGVEMDVGVALRLGCVPAVITDRPILDLPFGDVLRWSEIAVFVGTAGGAKGVKHVLGHVRGERYDRMQGMGRKASVHFGWDTPSERDVYRCDAFHTTLYQLWIRRHTIRYSRRTEFPAAGGA